MKNVTYTINKHTNKKLQEKRTQPVIISQCVIIHSMHIVLHTRARQLLHTEHVKQTSQKLLSLLLLKLRDLRRHILFEFN